MRIVIQMGDSYPDESPCSKRMRTFYEAFCRYGDEVYVLAPGKEPDTGSAFGAVYCPTVPLRKKNTIYRLLNSAVFAFTSFSRAMRIRDIDVVITTCPPPLINLSGLAISRCKKARLVYDVRDIWPDVAWEMGSLKKSDTYSRIFEWIRDRLLKRADLTLAVSTGKVNKLREYMPKAKIIEITNGLDEEFLNNTVEDDIVERYGLGTRTTVCYIGNLGYAQGLRQLLFIAEKSKEENLPVQFLLFGSGAEEAELKAIAKEKKLDNVSFPGRIPNRQIYTVLSHSDISFVSLVNDRLKDSVPTKIYEALGVGCPILLAAEGDAAKVVLDSGFGRVVKPNEHEELWAAFRDMLDHLDEYRLRREQVSAYAVEHYSRQKEAEKLADYLHNG